MPLVVPGITSNAGGSITDQWSQLLMGKKLSDQAEASSESVVSKKDLPQNHRVVQESGGMMTMDYKKDRLNLHVDKDGVVKKVTSG